MTRNNEFPSIGIMEETVRQAGEIAMEHYGRAIGSRTFKKDGSPVTMADTEIESFLKQRFGKLLDDAGIEAGFIGEEGTYETEKKSSTTSSSHRAFIVDPIDGTSSFAEGRPFFTICVGWMEAGVLTRGVVYFPAMDRMFTASKGEGAFMNGMRIKADTGSFDTSEKFMNGSLMVPSNAHRELTIELPCKTRSLGSIAAHMVDVARSSAIGVVCKPSIWDAAASAVILEEAGGKLAALDGSPIDWSRWTNGERMPYILGSAPGMWTRLASGIKVRER